MPDKEYTILLLPDRETVEKIRDFRLKHIQTDQVDGIPFPHITLKRKFRLNDWFSENDLLKMFNSFAFSALDIDFQSVKIYSDAVVLKGESKSIERVHGEILDLLDGRTVTRSQYEGENYGVHLTLFRFTDNLDLSAPLPEATDLIGVSRIEAVILAEYGKDRDFYKELAFVKL